MAYRSCRQGENPLHWGVFVSDQDSASAAAVQEAREECEEERVSDWQYCSQHLLKGSHRLLNKSLDLKAAVASDPKEPKSGDPSCIDPDRPFQCPRCSKGFKSSSGRATHARFCKFIGSSTAASGPSSAVSGPSSAVSGPSWSSQNGMMAKEIKPFKQKLLNWLLRRKNNELRRGVAAWKKWQCYKGSRDLELKHRLKMAAGTILPCLKGDHSKCIQYSFVCAESKDPYLYLLPHQRNVPDLPVHIQKVITDSIWTVFQTDKLDRLIKDGSLQTTSRVEAVHRTIRAPAPKGKPMRRNQTACLRFGGTIAAKNGRGKATISHFKTLQLPVSQLLSKKMEQSDTHRQRKARLRQSEKYRQADAMRRRQKFELHGRSLETKEATQYRKEGFVVADHSYSKPAAANGEFTPMLLTSLMLAVTYRRGGNHFFFLF